ncbi:MAG TPA: phosphosulfolactate synthase [Bacteroidales bacterium]|jgi:phosphosulfolactate synthase|nr:phosphosulfolactate synthase [Bacteroidales bacterium]HRS18665.1 phosphosulfolactate synthase [Bacteroidales bacterium]
MNFPLSYIPQREKKPRNAGQTMIIDKGLTSIEAQGLAQDVHEYIDFAKLGFGTSLITHNLEKKIAIYKEAGIIPYFGGTLFELFIIRNQFDEYQRFLDTYGIEVAEVSDGSMNMKHEDKLSYISQLSKHFTVISEVGSKDASVVITPEEWILQMQSELDAGSVKVITEARESGTIGIFNKDGSPNKTLINTIISNIDITKVMWEAPLKAQQALFIQLLGYNVNLGNIATNEVLALEALRLGLRGDTFFQFLPQK